MMKDEAAKRWQRIEELFRGAVELPEDERAEFLDAATGDDPELRREVDELLESDSEADDFITGAVRAGEELLTRSVEALPTQFGKYEVESRLGEGGFGVVYRGRDPMLDRPVAIKACSSSDAGMRKRFYREARIAAGLRHVNITTVHELGVEDGVPFIVQELLEGEDLRQIVGEGRPLPVATAVSYLVQIARGLEHAHGSGVLHRDVKPANVRIQPDGSVKLMDFGIAKILGADTGLTGTGMTLGTVGYLAPEQLRSEEVDERADIFAFGVLAYELLGRRRPFVGDDFSQVSYQLLYVEPPSLKKRWPGCPQALADLVHRCLHKEKLQRPGSMEPVRRILEDLHRSLEGQPDRWIEAADGAVGGAGRSEGLEPESVPSKGWGRRLAAVGAAALMAGTLTWGWMRSSDVLEMTEEIATASLRERPASLLEVPSGVPEEEPILEQVVNEGPIGTPSGEEPHLKADEPKDAAAKKAPNNGSTLTASPPAVVSPAARSSVAGDTIPADEANGPPSGLQPESIPQPISEGSLQPQVEPGPTSLTSLSDRFGESRGPVAPASADPVVPKEALAAPSSTTEGDPADPLPTTAETGSGTPGDAVPPSPVDAEEQTADTSSPSAMRRGDMITAEGPGVVPPQLLQRPQPVYPPRARRRGIEQQVVVKVLVDEDGGVVQVIAPGSDTHGFLAAARNAAREARFEPARRDGIEGRMWVNLNFDFTLD